MNTKDTVDLIYYIILAVFIGWVLYLVIKNQLEKRMMDDFIEEVKEENRSIREKLFGDKEGE